MTASTDRWWVTRTEAARILGLSYPALLRMIRDGELPTVRVGMRDVVRTADLAVLIGPAAEQPPGA